MLEKLKQAIVEQPKKLEVWLVYADYLQSKNILQGELIKLHFAYQEANNLKQVAISKQINYLVHTHWDQFNPIYWPSFQDKLVDGKLGPEMMVIPPSNNIDTFCIGKYPITEYEFNFYKSNFRKNTQYPITCIHKLDICEYCYWLQEQTGYFYRPAFSEEWIYAAYAGTNAKYWWGNTITPQYANYINKNLFFSKSKLDFVYSFYPNPWGLYQIHGNVWEWVSIKENFCSLNVVCGGAYNQNAQQLNKCIDISILQNNRKVLEKIFVEKMVDPFIFTSNWRGLKNIKNSGFRIVKEFKKSM